MFLYYKFMKQHDLMVSLCIVKNTNFLLSPTSATDDQPKKNKSLYHRINIIIIIIRN